MQEGVLPFRRKNQNILVSALSLNVKLEVSLKFVGSNYKGIFKQLFPLPQLSSHLSRKTALLSWLWFEKINLGRTSWVRLILINEARSATWWLGITRGSLFASDLYNPHPFLKFRFCKSVLSLPPGACFLDTCQRLLMVLLIRHLEENFSANIWNSTILNRLLSILEQLGEAKVRRRGVRGVKVLLKRKESFHSFICIQSSIESPGPNSMLINLQTEMCNITPLHL